jgi:predicted nucleotide-binding protein
MIQPYLAGAHGSLTPANGTDPVTGSWRLPSSVPVQGAHQIFVVQGHDKVARDELELVLHRLDLEPYILMNSNPAGKTIIDALEGKIGKNHESDFGIVLSTPDDMGYPKQLRTSPNPERDRTWCWRPGCC